MATATIIYIIIGVIILWAIWTFNGFIRAKYRTEEAWSDIEVQMKRRYDLIPNLVETVKGYAKHESGVFEKVTAARTAAMNAKTMPEKAGAENALAGTLKTLFAVSENYPDLKANQNFLNLQDELTDTEDKIQAARRFYNSMVMDFNTKIAMFPYDLIAGLLHFTKKEFFDLDEEAAKEPVKVTF